MKTFLRKQWLLLAVFYLIAGFSAHAQSLRYGFPYTLANSPLVKASFDVSAQVSSPTATAFSSDGLKMFVADFGGSIYQYSLSTAFDLSSTVTYNGSLDVSTNIPQPNGLAFSDDGLTLFVTGTGGTPLVEQFSLTSAFTITSGVTSDFTYNVSSQEGSPRGMTFNADGTKMYIIGNNGDEVNQYTLSSPFDISGTVTHNGQYSVSSQENNPQGLQFSADGLTLFIVGTTKDSIHVYSLTNAYDVTSGTISLSSNFYVGTIDATPGDIVFDNTGATLFLTGASGRDITPFDLNAGGFKETSENLGEVEGSLTISLEGDTFNDAGGTLTYGSDYIVSQPGGLTSVLSVASDGKSAVLTYTGNAINNQAVNSINDINFTFFDVALVGGDASAVENAVGASSGFSIRYKDNPVITYPTVTLSESSANDGSITGDFTLTLTGDTFTNAGGTLTSGVDYVINTLPAGLSATATVSGDGSSLTFTFSGKANNHQNANDVKLALRFGNSAFTNSVWEAVVGAEVITSASTISVDFDDNAPVLSYSGPGFTENSSNNGSVTGSLTVSIEDDVFTNPGGSLTHGADYTITNLPAGLIPALSVAGDGESATLSLSNRATSNDNDDDLSGLIFTFENSAFSIGDVSIVTNAVAANSAIGIDFVQEPVIRAQSFDLAENSANGTVVGTVDAADTDGSIVSFAITGGNTSSAFAINPTTGQFGVNTASAIDYETNPIFTLTVSVSDNSGLSNTGTITVNLTNVVEAPTDITLSAADIDEENAINAVIGSFTTTDPDAGETYIYTLVTGTGDTDNGSFNISGSDLRASEVFDFETKSSYTIRVQSSDGSFTTQKVFSITINDVMEDNTWTGAIDNLWSRAGNWSKGAVPTSADDVVIPNVTTDPVIFSGQAFIVNDLTIESGGVLTVESGGGLAIIGTVSNSGTYTISRNTTGNAAYSIIGSPITSATTMFDLADADYIYEYANPSGFSMPTGFGSMTPGKGYFVGFDEASPTISFTGTPNTGIVTYSVLQTSGYELLSNPYSAAISINSFLSDNSSVITGGVYFWDDGGANVGPDQGGDYIVANGLGSASAVQPSGTEDGVDGNKGTSPADNGFITSMQGFFVEVQSSGSIDFDPNMQSTTSGSNNDANYYRVQEYQKIKLVLEGNRLYNEVLVGMSDDATYGRDHHLDARKMKTDNPLQFYSLIGDERFAIQGLPLVENVPVHTTLGMEVGKEGRYQLSVMRMENIPDDIEVMLLDQHSGKEYILDESTAIELDLKAEGSRHLFQLIFRQKRILSTIEGDQMQVVPFQQGVTVFYPSQSTEKLEIYTLGGVQVYEGLADFTHGHATVNVELSSGHIYLMKINESVVKFNFRK